MPKQLYVNLKFTADAEQAKKQIQDLTKSLQQISLKTPQVFDDQILKNAVSAAQQLQQHLAAAVNVDTGKINLNEFTRQLNKSGRSLEDLHKDLIAIGPDGSAAFNKLTKNLLQAETQTSFLAKKMKSFLGTLQNTFRWQVSSGILHGLQGAVQSAFYYAQDLDKSLNNIRIVTGQSADQMAQFAKQANAAAQALSTTTTAYTDASLIYYQQGLSDEEVKARTDVTIKMANVTGQSAETISEQMTAVWNNFYDGSQTLESFADKMTALGATTASSSAEIAQGLNQFAATANTVGLSFDYAAAALATVTATTRQSANVVGNAFKTLFARLEGLKLGETLDDGTTLNKYSAALEAVGVSIKDQNGELKAMDTILDELGTRWQTLSKEQQVALAQTVGGVRQYTQLIALMDSWDFMQRNVATARGSEGTLQTQQDIYTEGWQAAKKKVQAALESIYQTLIDETKLKKLYNFGATALDAINGIIKGLGGVKGILTQVVAIILQLQAKNMSTYINNMVDGFNKLLNKTPAQSQGIFSQLAEIYNSSDAAESIDLENNPVSSVDTLMVQDLIKLKQTLVDKEKEFSVAEKEAFQYQMSQIEAAYQLVKIQAQQIENGKSKISIETIALSQAKKHAEKNKTNFGSEEREEVLRLLTLYQQQTAEIRAATTAKGQLQKQSEIWAKTESSNLDDVLDGMTQAVDKLKEFGVTYKSGKKDAEGHIGVGGLLNWIKHAKEAGATAEQAKAKFNEFLQNTNVNDTLKTQITATTDEVERLKEALQAHGLSDTFLEKIRQDANLTEEQYEALKQGIIAAHEEAKKMEGASHQFSNAEGLATFASGIMRISAGMQSAIGIFDTWSDKSATGLQKFTSLLSGAPMIINSVKSGIESLTKVVGGPWAIAISAAIALFTAFLKVFDEIKKKAAEARREAIDTATEQLKETSELVETNQELVKNLNALENKIDENGNATDEYVSQLEALIDAYDIVDGYLLLLSKDYDRLTESIKASMIEQLKEQQMQAQTTKSLIEDDIFASDWYAKLNNNKGQQAGIQQNILRSQKDSDAYKGLQQLGYLDFNGVLDFSNLQVGDLQQIYSYLKDLNALDFDGVSELRSFLQSDDWKNWQSADKTDITSGISQQFLSSDIKNIQDYAKAYQSLIKTYKESDVSAVGQSYYKEFAQQYSAFLTKTQKLSRDKQDELLKYFSTLSDDQRYAFLSIDIDEDSSEENITAAIKNFQERHKSDQILIEISTYKNAADTYKEGMSREELLKWKDDSGIDWGNAEKGILTWEEFLRRGYTAGHEWLLEQQNSFENSLVQTIESDIQKNEEEINRLEEQKEELYQQIASIEQGFIKYNDINYTYEELSQLYNDIVNKNPFSSELKEIDNLLTSFENGAEEREARISNIRKKIANIDNNISSINEDNNNLNDSSIFNSIINAQSATSIKELSQQLHEGKIIAEDFYYRMVQIHDEIDKDIDADEFKDMCKYLKENAEIIDDISDELKVNDKALRKVSEDFLRFDKAIERVNSSYNDWMNALEKGTVQDQAKAMKELGNTYADVLGLENSDALPENFLKSTENLSLMNDALNGVDGAYEQLQENAAKAILQEVGLNTDRFQADKDFIESSVSELTGREWDDIEVGASLNNDAFLQSLTDMVNAAGLSADQATAYLASMGVDAEVTEVDSTATENNQNVGWRAEWNPAEATGSVPMADGMGGFRNLPIDYKAYSLSYQPDMVNEPTEKEQKAFSLKVTSAHKSSGGGVKWNNVSHGGGGGGSKGGGGGGSAPKKQTAKKTDTANTKPNQKVEDRYHIINNQIEDLAHQYDKLSEAEERAFGKSKLALMDQQKDKLMEQYEAQKKLRTEAEKYWKEDLENLRNGSIDSDGDGEADTFGSMPYLGMDIELDENGTITNYEDLRDAANKRFNDFINNKYNDEVEKRNERVAWYNDLPAEKQAEIEDAWKAEEEAWNAKKETLDEELEFEQNAYDNFFGLIDQYEETQDKVQEELNKEIEAYHAVLDKMLEKTEYAVQVRLDVDEDSLKLLQFLMETLEDNPYRAAEAIQNLNDQFEVGKDKIEIYEKGLENLFDNHFSDENGVMSKFGEIMSAGLGEGENKKKYTSGADIMEGLKSGELDAQTLVDTLGSMTDEFTEKEIEDIRKWSQSMQDEAANQIKIRQELFDKLDDAINQTNEDLDRQRSKIENLNKVLDHYNNLIDLVGRDRAGLDTSEMIANAEHQLTVLNAQTSADMAIMEEARAVYDRLMLEQGAYKEGSNEWALWKKRVEEAEDRLNETTENYYSSWEAALEAVRKKFDDTMTWMAEDYSKTLGGTAGSLEGLQNLMDQYEKTHSTYVPEYERVYQLNKLNAEAIKAIDETNNIKAKQELQKYQQKILDAQESGREMSEYELQNLEKELALRQAALALEEATNVKSQVRMQRDNEGNYSYVYTADESAVGDAEANYRDKLYEMQKANAEYINELQTNIVSLQQDYINAVQQAAEIYGIGTDEYYAALDKINTYYNDAMKAQYAELELAMDNNQDLQAFDAEFHHRMTGDKMVSDQGYITEFSQTLLSEQSGLKTSEEGFSTWKDASTGAMDLAKQAAIDYNGALEEAMNAAGTTLNGEGGDGEGGAAGDLKSFASIAVDEFEKAAKAADSDEEPYGLKQTIANMAEDAKNTLLGEDGKSGLIGDVSTFCKGMSDYLNGEDGIIPKIKNLSTNLNTVVGRLAGVKKGVEDLPTSKEVNVQVNVPEVDPIEVEIVYKYTTEGSPPSETGGGSGGGDGDGNTGGGQKTVTGTSYTDWSWIDGEYHARWKITSYSDDTEDKKYEEQRHKGSKGQICPICGGSVGGSNANFDTGGYTGSWGPEGKIATLHEKELVLNKDDTSNMLAAVSMIRQISSIIDLNAQSAGGAFSSLFSGSVFMNSEPLQQDVHITAEFPNATDRDEILAAFDNVINLASQYANRKGPSIDRVSPMF